MPALRLFLMMVLAAGPLALSTGCDVADDDDSAADDDADSADDDDDSADDDDDGGDADLDCDDPQDPPPPVTDCGLHEGLTADENYTTFRSSDGSVEVVMVREYVAQGAGHSTIWGLIGFGAVVDGCVVCVDDTALLAYDNSHHNWADAARLSLDGVELRLTIDYVSSGNGWDWAYALSGISPADPDVVLWGPVPLDATGGMIPQ